VFERLGDEGRFAAEPDFPEALAIYRAEVERNDPNTITWEWLAAMYERVSRGQPPLTVEEFVRLSEWNRKHQDKVHDVNLCGFQSNPAAVARRMGATRIARRLRRLRAEHPELE
jgi:hypothetical protein